MSSTGRLHVSLTRWGRAPLSSSNPALGSLGAGAATSVAPPSSGARPFASLARRGGSVFDAPPMLPPGVVAAEVPAGARGYSSTPVALGGRHTTSVPERVTRWREHLSKKAQKKHKKKVEASKKKGGGGGGAGGAFTPAPGSGASALSVRRDASLAAAPLPPPEVLRAQAKQSRTIIESILVPQTAPPTPQQALRSVDADAMLAGLARGDIPETLESYNYLIRVLGAQNRFDEAVEAFVRMRKAGVEPTAHSFTALITACARQRNVTAAQAVFEAMVGAGIKPSAVSYGALIQAYIRAGDISGGFKALAACEAEGVKLTTPLFSELMVGCVHSGAYEKAWEVFHHMRTYHADTCPPDAVTYTILINACAKRDEVERALGLLTEMKQYGVTPTHVTYNALIHTAGRSFRRYEHAFQLFSEMKVAGFAPDLESYHGVLLACSHKGDVPRARTLMHSLIGDGLQPNTTTFNTLLAVFARSFSHLKVQKDTPESIIAARAAGGDLTVLDDPALAEEAAARTKKWLGDNARLIDGDPDALAERLLADYFAPDHGRVDSEDERVMEEAPEEQVHRMLPELKRLQQDLDDPEYRSARDYLIKAGVGDAAFFEELEADNSRPPPLDSEEEEVRALVDARQERVWRDKAQADILRLAEAEAEVARMRAEVERDSEALKKALSGDTAEARRLMGLADDGGAAVDKLLGGLDGSGELVFDDLLEQLEEKHGGSASAGVAGAKGRAGRGASANRSLATISPLLATSRTDGRVSFVEYMKRLEADIEDNVFGTAVFDEEKTFAEVQQASAALEAVGGDASALAASGGAPPPMLSDRHRRVSMFDEDGIIGGQRVKDLLDIRDIPIPSTSDSEGDHDIIKLHDYYAGKVAERVMNALAKEYEPEIKALARSKGGGFSDPEMSDSAPLYRAIAGGKEGPASGAEGGSAAPAPAPAAAAGPADAAVAVSDSFTGSEEEAAAAPAPTTEQVASFTEPPPVPGMVRRRRSGRAPANRVAPRPSSLAPALEPEPQQEATATPSLADAATSAATPAPAVSAEAAPSAAAAAAAPEGVAAPVAGRATLPLDMLEEAVAASAAAADESLYGSAAVAREAERLAADLSRAVAASGTRSAPELLDAFKTAQSEVARVAQELAEVAQARLSGGPVPPGTDEAAFLAAPLPPSGEFTITSKVLPLPDTPEALKAAVDAARAWKEHEAQQAADAAASPAGRRRSFVARIMAKMLKASLVDPVTRDLVEAVEPVEKYRKRRVTQAKPGFADALFAAQTLKERMAAAAKEEGGNIGDALAAVPGGGDGSGVPSEVAAAVQARHAARQQSALTRLEAMTAAGGKRSGQMQALAAMSDKLLAGAHWLPPERYPTDPLERRKVLLVELERIYYEEIPRNGLAPDQITLNTMVSAYAAAGLSRSAYDFVETEFSKHGARADTRTYRALISMQVRQHKTAKAESTLAEMKAAGVAPDKDCYGAVVHALARDWRLKDAIAVIKEMKGAGLTCSEHWAFLLRQRCKEIGIFHPDVPEHPVGWQFRPEVMAKRRAKGTRLNKLVKMGMPKQANGWR